MTTKDKEQLANRHGVKLRFIYLLLAGERFTIIPDLAIEIAAHTGKKPINYFHPRLRKLVLPGRPELNVVHKHSLKN